MSRWERVKLSVGVSLAAFLLQVALLVFDVQLVDESTGQFRLGAELRFKFVDETTRQFVLVSQLQRLPEQLLVVLEISAVVAVLSYAATGLTNRYRLLAERGDPATREPRGTAAHPATDGEAQQE